MGKIYEAPSCTVRETEGKIQTQSKLLHISHKDIIYTYAIYYICIFSYTCMLYYTNIYTNKKSVNTTFFFTHIYRNYIAQNFKVKESEDEWWLCEVVFNISH